jgi:hypothetical protein
MTADEVAMVAIVVGTIALCAAIWGSLRRGPTLAERYKTGSAGERARIDEEIKRKPWMAPFVLPVSGWSIALGIILFVVLRFVLGIG